MNKTSYLKELKKSLSYLPPEETEEILYDYEEHFQMGSAEGKNEDEIIKALGNPQTIAKQYKASSAISIAENKSSPTNVLRALVAIISLGFFNLIFVLGPFLAVAGVLIGLFGASVGIVVGGVSLFLRVMLGPVLATYVSLPSVLLSNTLGSIFLSIGLTSLGILLFIGCCYLTKFISILTIKYLKFNLKIIQN